MADKKRSIRLPILMIILVELIGGLIASIICCGCASQTTRKEDSNHYRAQVEQGYPCPECGHSISVDKISANIRVENKCPSCGEIFFGKPPVKSQAESEPQGKSYQWPNILVRGYHHDIKHDNNTKYSVENNWNVSEDGNKGSINSTTIITNEHNVKGEYGRTIGPAGLGRYGYGGY